MAYCRLLEPDDMIVARIPETGAPEAPADEATAIDAGEARELEVDLADELPIKVSTPGTEIIVTFVSKVSGKKARIRIEADQRIYLEHVPWRRAAAHRRR